MKTNFILFGPPGIGKSTLLGHLKTSGIGAIDLEDLYPNRVRFQIPNLVQGIVLGAADLSPRRQYPHSKKILLYADQVTYGIRRGMRDKMQPGKSMQSLHDVADWLKDVEYDYILDTSREQPMDTAARIIQLMKGEEGNE